ncbi:universal stress protein [Pseudomonas sp. NPDC089734]|uniref:universal stress protein n=1 Tax=Pseudomonas sp. NPDC089734 TaxID=3364469 RepID=UPI0038210930
MFKTILVALDGSPQSRKVLELASSFARSASDDTRLHLVCVLDPAYALDDSKSLFANQEYPAAATEQHHAEDLIESALLQLQERGIHCSAQTLTGDPAQAICEEATRIDSQLIVIGHRHLTFLGRLLDPSVGGKILNASPCPVLVEVR